MPCVKEGFQPQLHLSVCRLGNRLHAVCGSACERVHPAGLVAREYSRLPLDLPTPWTDSLSNASWNVAT
jgi:hypothetical protein